MSSVAFGQTTAIPDPNFEQALIDFGYDNILDGQVLTSNIVGVTNLDIPNLNISNLSGIQDFSSLNELRCHFNNINSFDFSQNNNIEFLEISGNPVNTLVLNNLSNLKELWIDFTNISSIDLSSNIYLEDLFFGGFWEDNNTGNLVWSQMNSIDLSANIYLMNVGYYGGELESLDLSNCIVNGYSDIDIVFPINMSCLNLANGTNGVMPNGGDIISLNIDDEDDWGIACPSLCIEVDNTNIANSVWNNNIDHPNYNFSLDCGNCLSVSNLLEQNTNNHKKLSKILDLLGRETSFKPNTPLIYVYDDGSTKKVFVAKYQ